MKEPTSSGTFVLRSEVVLWSLMKDARRAEARVCVSAGQPQLRFYVDNTVLWSMALLDAHEVSSIAAAQRRELEADGWLTTL